ncbi:HNH endonuclease [Metapseudomonas otitidis]|uniref:HNH endonuclease n=1 Tax=Metapseudomonas otitidis TaxID=319939 RepID=UPI00244680B6|nr:HNH endonuclease [Pseudomonas otitidis]MDH0335159.1 HNH endonuclease [Pseudomonas otitidis]
MSNQIFQPYRIIGSCPVCGDNSEDSKASIYEYSLCVEGACVCGSCAERIANAYSMKHSGRWLTWPNDRAATPKKAAISHSLRTQVFERDAYRCLRCGTHHNLRADHVVPESAGGETSLQNLQTLCAPCNSWKGVRIIDFRAVGN